MPTRSGDEEGAVCAEMAEAARVARTMARRRMEKKVLGMDGSWTRGHRNRRESTVDSQESKAEESELKRRLAIEMGTPPPVFFVRVANTGVRLDAARKSGRQRT
jgi:hypothetical protein